MSDVRSRSYETHFYCALCGGPFAQVFRTAVNPAQPSYAVGSEQDIYNSNTGDEDQDEDDRNEDLDIDNEFNISPHNNRCIPGEVVRNSMSHAASRSRELRLVAEEEGRRRGMVSEKRKTMQAYNGKHISTRQMKWTKNLRALIYKKSNHQPLNHEHYGTSTAYLTGRGLIRQVQNWADAFASVDEEDGDDNSGVHTEHPFFSDEDKQQNTYGFHVYQELGRPDSRYVISSIPFHDECWSLLDLAIEESGKERGVVRMNERFDMDELWGYLRGLVGVTGVIDSAIVPNSTAAALSEERRGSGVVSRLGEVDYREGQGSGDGWQWKHEEGLHWLAADPSLISVLHSPLLPVGGTQSRSCAPRAALEDPFQSMPPEILLEFCKLLTSTDVFSLKTASPAVHNLCLPDSFYRRFLREEFQYLPTLVKEVKDYEACLERLDRPVLRNIDWRGSFERLRKRMMTPKSLSDSEDEWDAVDIGLKNRNRIWKIVKPMADELVEGSDVILQHKYQAPESKAEKTGVVRGYAGVRTGKEGTTQSVYFGSRMRDRLFEGEDEDLLEIILEVDKVRVWLDGEDGPVCGLGFYIVSVSDAEKYNTMQKLGRRGSAFVDLDVRPEKLTGFVFCLANQIISGIQLVYGNDHTFSKKFGHWNGNCRKITAPAEWRKLVGVIGFVNSAGFIETLGILEETIYRGRRDRFGPLPTPPSTVDLSHGEASVWKKLPPANASLLEREGLHIMDWRMCTGEWEIWDNGFHEEGAEAQVEQQKSLKEIVGYYDDKALRGLKFVYREHGEGNREFTSILGTTDAIKSDRICFEEGKRDPMAAIVISFGDAGIHGILFVTESGLTSEVFGPRYLGTHKVFASTSASNIDGPSHTIFRKETNGDMIGLHCLYDYEQKRFLQLGLVLLTGSERHDDIYGSQLRRPIPFNDMTDKLQVWDDGPPPSKWSIGSRPGDMGICDRTFSEAEYTGWASFEYLRKITIYGKMKGIRFSFSQPQERDRFFGYDNESEGIFVQEIDYDNGERIFGIAVLPGEEATPRETQKAVSGDEELVESASCEGDYSPPLERIYFLTNWNRADAPTRVKYRLSCPYLKAIKFDFNYHKLISWAPIYAPSDSDNESSKVVSEMVQYPWKCRTDEIMPVGDIKPTSRVACVFFDDEAGKGVDAVKGYVSKSGQFCGLVFRRGGSWCDNVFGHRSAYEVTMELKKGEKFTSLYSPDGNTGALALCTSMSRTTPWFGTFSGHVRLKQAPEGQEAVGIYGTLDREIPFFTPTREAVVLDTVGLLYRPKKGSRKRSLRIPSPPTTSGFQILDKATKLRWFSNIKEFPRKTMRFSSLVAQRTELYSDSDTVGRTYCIFDPSQLEQILVCVNLFKHKGITSIRFRGSEKMGLVTMGEWPDREPITVKPRQKMSISGLNGERIIRIKVAFQRSDTEDRIVGLVIETNAGRSKTIVSSEMFPEKPIHLSAHNVKVLECGENDEIVGFHGVVSTYNIHDIGLVVRRK
ncbi:uncharacterized protein H6S33_012652 [Morchella sextelata]|uniref:uncharacterized protein n=1 Tax=Morchella sextelata TaxID=1174677 RepID=UPI001D04B4AF|nr:uncharacterized protein H6S33_012652 [Morchella sextelata]KAH0610106.1 hypothetical protein H6S33_012652 [Morchella sextelata]